MEEYREMLAKEYGITSDRLADAVAGLARHQDRNGNRGFEILLNEEIAILKSTRSKYNALIAQVNDQINDMGPNAPLYPLEFESPAPGFTSPNYSPTSPARGTMSAAACDAANAIYAAQLAGAPSPGPTSPAYSPLSPATCAAAAAINAAQLAGPPPREFLPESNKEKRRKTKLVVSDPVSVVSDPVSVATAEDWLEMRRAVHNRKLAGSSMHGWYMHEEDDEDTDSEALVDFMMYGLCLSINKERLG